MENNELINTFLNEIDKHLNSLIKGDIDNMFEINEFAKILHIHPTYFSNLVKEKTGRTPCHFYQEKILKAAQTLIKSTTKSISEIAYLLSYDPSNFTKIFKRYIGETPKQFRKKVLSHI